MAQRPPHVQAPSYLSPDTPVPEPKATPHRENDPVDKDPTRYGDWERKGIAIDF